MKIYQMLKEMSRVIKTPEENALKVEWVKQVDYPMCHALIEYSNLDIYNLHHGIDDEDVIDCPYCKRWFLV